MGTVEVDDQAMWPEDPLLAAAAKALDEGGLWGYVVDESWRLVYFSREARGAFGYGPVLGQPLAGTAWLEGQLTSPRGPNTLEMIKASLGAVAGMMLADLGRDAVTAQVDPRLLSEFVRVDPNDAPVVTSATTGSSLDGRTRLGATMTLFRVRCHDGRLAGTVITFKPAPGMSTLALLLGNSDLGHVRRMHSVAFPGRRPAAVLFADLEGSSPLARRLSTAAYFELASRLVVAADRCVVDAGGLVGRHVGDGVAAFFLAEHAGSESGAARACIGAARALPRRDPRSHQGTRVGPG